MDYLKIFEDIVKYYPIGISQYDPKYLTYSGTISLQRKCYDKLESPLYKKWKMLVGDIKKESGVASADAESPLFYPCYTGNLLIHKEKRGAITFKRSLVFHLSLLGPYYTIYGLDSVIIKGIDGKYSDFEPLLYASPIDVYEEFFPLLRMKIEEIYHGYQLLSQYTLGKRVKSLDVCGAKVKEGQDSSVFQALFTFDDITNYKILGDFRYA